MPNKEAYLIATTPDGKMALAQKVNTWEEARNLYLLWQSIPPGATYQIGFITTPSPMTYVGDTIPQLIDQVRGGQMPSEIVLEFVPHIPPARRPHKRTGPSMAEQALAAFIEKAAVNGEKAGMILFDEKGSSSAVTDLKKAHPTGFLFASRTCEYNGVKGVGIFVEIVET